MGYSCFQSDESYKVCDNFHPQIQEPCLPTFSFMFCHGLTCHLTIFTSIFYNSDYRKYTYRNETKVYNDGRSHCHEQKVPTFLTE